MPYSPLSPLGLLFFFFYQNHFILLNKPFSRDTNFSSLLHIYPAYCPDLSHQPMLPCMCFIKNITWEFNRAIVNSTHRIPSACPAHLTFISDHHRGKLMTWEHTWHWSLCHPTHLWPGIIIGALICSLMLTVLYLLVLGAPKPRCPILSRPVSSCHCPLLLPSFPTALKTVALIFQHVKVIWYPQRHS